MYQSNQLQQQIQRLRDEANTISNLAGQLQQAEMNNTLQLQQLQQKEVNVSQQLQRIQYTANQLHQDINQINNLAQQMSAPASYQTAPSPGQGASFNPTQYGGFGTNQPGWSTQPGGSFTGGGQFFATPAQRTQATQYEASRYGEYSPVTGSQGAPAGTWGNISQTTTPGQ